MGRSIKVLCVAGVAAAMFAGCASSSSAEKKDQPAQNATAGADDLKNKMGNCPAAVSGAVTTVEDLEDGVAITVKAADEAGSQEVRERTARLVQSAAADVTGEHNRGGGSGGGLGHCPVILKDTTLTAEDVEGGSRITVKPAAAEGLDALKAASHEKLDALPAALEKMGMPAPAATEEAAPAEAAPAEGEAAPAEG